ncbi:choice-of-anchor Q domain-containing protein [Uliginosibacterium sp. 31-16]|uniref:choice-of-anchor Q domain-containing protein n=1 Tax=Uliginosibacterium sp. 31-16 TaxID=3068315 RepID=UPI00273E5297|nr:choice-of-anchor Q domain-containing protein [Uliginosibacterium sp. 31-16]MDP5239047.1 choice-of-anchor Q domain-containing protein [Uliginosibacterium sp. 31-16]
MPNHATFGKTAIVMLMLASLCSCGGGGGGGSSGASGSSSSSSSGAGSTTSSSGGSSVTPSATCDIPTAWALPTTRVVVGQGTAASCTETALRTAAQSGGHITFACGQSPVTIPVSSEIRFPNATVIDGAGLITLDGGGKNRILVSANNRSLSVRNMRFINGAGSKTMEGAGIGGAVSGEYLNRIEVINSRFENNTAGRGGGAVGVGTASTLVIVGSTFTGNSSWYGGAVYSLLSPLTIVNSVFSGNFTTTDGSLGDGGAIGTDGASTSPDDSVGGDVYICGTQITGNKGYGNGGGAYLWVYPPDRIIIDRTTVSANSASPNGRNNNGLGGAMRVSNGEIIIRRSSFLSNTSDGNGGGLYLDCAPSCTLNNDTFHGNVAKSYGGAIFGDGHSSNNVTFASNQAGGHGGAIFGTGFSVNNSVFLDNSAGNSWGQAMSCSTTGTGANVVQWLTAKSNGGSDTCVPSPKAVAPMLSAPADNGGPTWTMLPAKQSPLLNAGSGCTTEDQRGELRNTARCDLGSVELN